MKLIFNILLFNLLFVIFSPVRILYSQWEYDGVFPDPTNPSINQSGGIHGLAVDPEGKIWSINYYAYDRDIIYVAANINQYVPVRAVYVFNPDGTQAPFSPIKFVTINGITDTLGGYTSPANTWEIRTGRGMKTAPDGNIVLAMYDTYYKINYLTGEGINKVTPAANITATAPAFSENGHMFTGPVLPGNLVKEFDENFNFLRDVISSSIGFSRAFEVSKDGLTLFWAGYNNNCVYKYSRPDIFSSFDAYIIILKGFAAESFGWHPTSEVLWVSAGSGSNLPNMYPDTLTYYSYCTWYGYNVNNNTITDSIKWENLLDPNWQRPRAIAFSPDGSAAYVGMFGDIYYDGIQKFTPPLPVRVVRPNGGELFPIGYTEPIKWISTVNNVRLEYSTDSGNNWNTIESSIPAATGQYNWLVPNAPSENSLVRISDATNDTVFDVSDNVFTIYDPPKIITNTSLLEFQAGTGDTLRSNFMIYNTGGSDLIVDISDEVSGTTGSDKLFGAGNNMIYEINPDNGQIINNFPTPVFAGYYNSGLAFSGEYLFFTDQDYTSNIFVMNPDNGNLITYFPTNSTYCDGLAYVDPYLFVRDGNNNSIKVLNPTNGNLVKVIYPSVNIYGGLDGGNDRLFASDNNTIYELNPLNGSVVNTFYANNPASGIGFTGERLFTSISWAGIDEYDPNTGSFIRNISATGYAGLAGGGKNDAKWISENPEEATISAGDSVSISLLFVTPNELGHYTADIILKSNDPDSSVTRLQVVLDIVMGVEEENSLPTVYSLFNNYPNPFNPATTIKYDIPEQSYVTIKIYNIVGEEVTTLLNEGQTAGRYQLQWNASELSSGVYFYRIQAGSFSDTKKMILMK